MATHSIYSSEEEEEYDGPRLSQAIVLPTSLNHGRKTRKEGHKTLLVTEPACRIGNTDWCQCGHCCRMPTSVECVCCHDVRQIKQKVEGLEEQEIQICRLQAAGAMVLGFSRQKHQGASTSLCRENDQGHFPRRRKSGVQTPPAGGNRVTLC
ncbi:uncharacterized protein [Littorina saxatilis]|uniref:uncharacterized protein n=1 Tax=Littorina saxatilis TaxID=31220 RepID=UPI0038B6335D